MMKTFGIAALGALALNIAGCGMEQDLRVTGVQKATSAIANIKTLWDNMKQGGDSTKAQNALIEVAKLPGGLAAMLLKPINVPVSASKMGTTKSALSFPDCMTLDAAHQSATLTGCTAGPVTASGSASRADGGDCGAGSQLYTGNLSLGLDSQQGQGTLGVTLGSGTCGSATRVKGSAQANVDLSLPGIPSTNMTIQTKFDVSLGSDGFPTNGCVSAVGSGTFVGGPIGGTIGARFQFDAQRNVTVTFQTTQCGG